MKTSSAKHKKMPKWRVITQGIVGFAIIILSYYFITDVVVEKDYSAISIIKAIFFPLFGIYHLLMAFGVLPKNWG